MRKKKISFKHRPPTKDKIVESLQKKAKKKKRQSKKTAEAIKEAKDSAKPRKTITFFDEETQQWVERNSRYFCEPEKPIDLTVLRKLASLFCTFEECAMVLGISLSSFHQYRHTSEEFRQAYDIGLQEGRISLRRAQYVSAVHDRNPTMLIWLGKNMLQQSEAGLRDDSEGKDAINDLIDQLKLLAAPRKAERVDEE